MTPADSFAQSRIEAEQLIRQTAPARLQDAIIERLLPAIALSAEPTDDAEIAVGASKFGGAPDVPDGFEWPIWDERPLSFVAQINLDELAPFDIEDKLPSSGVLSFFYFMMNEDEWPCGEIEEKDGWRVFHFAEALTRVSLPKKARVEDRLATATLAPRAVWSAPKHPYYVNGEQWNGWPDEEADAWFKMNETFETGAQHLMLGHPHNIQDDARAEAANTREDGSFDDFDDWHLLLQMATDDEIGWMWGDMGAMFYLMHRDDLAKREWDKCWLIAQCG